MKRKLQIYLLKSTDETSTKDKYVDYIQNKENKEFTINEIKIIHILEFNFINLNQFELMLNEFFDPNLSKYTCLIVTSRQIIEAMKLINLMISSEITSKIYCIYCVGEQTSNHLKSYLFDKYPILNNLVDIRIPTTKQNASELANLIVSENLNKPFNALFPCSTIRKDDLFIKLNEYKLAIEELKLYETVTSKNGIIELIGCLNSMNKDAKENESLINCFVLFSPSCVQSIFTNSIELEKIVLNLFENNNNFNYFISIGPSTSSKLLSYLNNLNKSFNYIEMNEPSPKGLFEALNIIYSKH